MTDIHSHLLAEIDDGAGSLEEACMMADIAVKHGTKNLVLTPHSNIPGGYQNYWGRELKRRFLAFEAVLQDLAIPLNLMMGMELYGTHDLAQKLSDGACLTLNGTRYALIEFAPADHPTRVNQVLTDVSAAGFTPVIAHPERYRFVQERPDLAEQWLQKGYLNQIDKGSILGSFGRRAAACSRYLLDHRLAHVIASDSHSPYQRTPALTETFEYVSERYSQALAEQWLEHVPNRLISDRIVEGYIE